MTQLPGASVLAGDDSGAVLLPYSRCARGLAMPNGAYPLLDLAAEGRDEAGLSSPKSRVRRHD